MAKKITACWLILILILPLFANISPAQVESSTNRLTLEEAIFHTIKNSSGLRNARVERIKKTAERREAVAALRMARRRQKYPWFTLLMDIELPQTHGLPKEVELLMKIPEVETELQTLREKEKYETLKARHDATEAYLDLLLAQYYVERKNMYIEETEETLSRVRRQYLTGTGAREDVEYLEAELEGFQKDLKSAVQDLEKQLDRLSRLTGIKLNTSTELEEYFPQAELNRQDLDSMIQHGVEHDFNLFQATQDRKIAQREVLELIGVYENRWGSKVRSMTRYIKNRLGNQVEKLDVQLDYDTFLNRYYEPALNRIEKPFSGSFTIKILFITISIPKEWFKMGHLGDRYFEDEKYALFTALVDREKAIDLENDIREDLIQQVKDTYFTLKQMENTYQEAKSNKERGENNYQMSLRDNRIGLVPFQELHSEKMNFYGQEDSLLEMKIDYGKTIAMFNLYTSGYLDVVQGDFETTRLFDGDSFLIDDVAEPSWYIQSVLSDYKFTFGVNIPEEYGVTHFQLLTSNQDKIGEKTEVSDTVKHLPVIFEDSSILYLKLYDSDSLKYIAELDGFDVYGPLVLKEADQFDFHEEADDWDKAVGAWNISAPTAFQASFEFNLQEEIPWDTYGLYYTGETGDEEHLLGGEKLPAGEALKHLPSTFTNLDRLVLKLYFEGEVAQVMQLAEMEAGAGALLAEE